MSAGFQEIFSRVFRRNPRTENPRLENPRFTISCGRFIDLNPGMYSPINTAAFAIDHVVFYPFNDGAGLTEFHQVILVSDFLVSDFFGKREKISPEIPH